MKFIALKTCEGGAKGRISFCCKALKVTRQGFHDYLKNRNKPWKHEELAAKMMEILSEDECNDTYGRERMHKALLLKYPDSKIPSETTGIPRDDSHRNNAQTQPETEWNHESGPRSAIVRRPAKTPFHGRQTAQ